MTKTTRRFAIGAGILLGVGAVFLAEEHIRGAMELHAWQRAMRAKGEKLTIAELTPPLTNLASRVIAPGEAEGLLGRATAPQVCPAAMQFVAPGKARVAWALSNWRTKTRTKPYGVVTNDWNESGLVGAFKSLREALPALRSDLTNHAFVVSLDYDHGYGSWPPHLSSYRAAGHALTADTVLALHEHRLDDATENLVAGAALLRLTKEERIPMSQMVRITTAANLESATWEALQADGWTDAQLSAIQVGWEPPDFMEGVVQACAMDRAMMCTFYDRDRYSNRELMALLQDAVSSNDEGAASGNLVTESLNGLGEASRPVRASLQVVVWRVAWADQDQLFYCLRVQRLIEAGRKTVADRKWSTAYLADKTVDDDPSPSVIRAYDRHRFPVSAAILSSTSIGLGMDKAIQAETVRELTLAAIALKRHQLRHGRLPKNLAVLVPEFLREVPRDWYNGESLHYRPNTDGTFLLYSVGEDGKDDGGDPTLPEGTRSPSFYYGRDLVWPMPATLEEVKAAEVRKR